MARNNYRNRNEENDGLFRPKQRDTRRRKKRNPIKGIEYIDYTNIKLLQRFLNDQGKILPRRITGVNAKQQRSITQAVKYARHLALLPFVAEDMR
ncbi:MAG: 30S ribosomal protein S18 [Ignavibacteriae bacterium]|nr:30S ribosomal protein S18 [Ignavibacteriota bacterium]MCB9217665.1 30S ribosomal protein S18 [Ignavibacteria bacterium]